MIKSHLSADQKQALLKKRWYFQGFNGTPALLSVPTRGNVDEGWQILGYSYTVILEYYEEDKCYYLYDWEDLEKNLQIILEKTRKDPSYPEWLVKKDRELREAHEKIVKKIEKINIEKLSYKEALEVYQEFIQSYRFAIAVSLIIECFTYPTEDLIRNTIKEELASKGYPEKAEEGQALLTSALHPSFIGKCQLELLKIAAQKKKGKDVTKEIEQYQKEFFWMSNAYAGAKVLSVKHFKHELEELIKKYPEPQKEIQHQEEHFATIQKRKKEFIKKYSLSKNVEMLISINNAMGIIHDIRKEVVTHANHFIDEFLKRFAKEKNVSIELMRYVSDYEINEKDLKSITREMLEQRHTKSVFVTLHPGEQYISTGKEAEEFIDELNKSQQHEVEEILKGHCASQGYAKGIVKVCRGMAEVAKFKEGEILVACMTQPEFVPAMKKAIAIVTDEGGLTCHAAIISRELKKPCIISTKKATRVLKDGMLVEVNATEGYVKIITQ